MMLHQDGSRHAWLSGQPALVSALLVLYPAWDAAANLVDARANGGLKANPAQAFNVAVSTITSRPMLRPTRLLPP